MTKRTSYRRSAPLGKQFQPGAEPIGPTLMHRNTVPIFFLHVLTIPKGAVHQGGLAVVHQVTASGPLFQALKAASRACEQAWPTHIGRKLSSSYSSNVHDCSPLPRYDGSLC
jgi:hypothetical protein